MIFKILVLLRSRGLPTLNLVYAHVGIYNSRKSSGGKPVPDIDGQSQSFL
jgi:hypothetical protein